MSAVTFSLIVAMDRNRLIGHSDGLLPWPRIGRDMQRFSQLTKGRTVIVSRKTLQSINCELTDRFVICVSRSREYAKNAQAMSYSVENAIDTAQQLVSHTPFAVAGCGSQEVMVIGGGEIYRELMPFVSTIHLTVVNEEYTVKDGVYFPEIVPGSFFMRERDPEKGMHASSPSPKQPKFVFGTFERKTPSGFTYTREMLFDIMEKENW